MSPRRSLFGRKEQTLVASGHKVKLSDTEAVKAVLQARQDWQPQAWETYDAVGQVKYGINVLASLCSRVPIYAAEMPEQKDAEPIRTSNKEVITTLERLGDVLAQSDLIRELAINLLVTGECFLICFGERDGRPERWEIRSQDEVQTDSGKVKVADKESSESVVKWIELNESAGDTFIRIWRQHARKHYLADSHLRGILDAAEELLWWNAAARSRAKSRLNDSGILCVPSDMELPASTPEDLKMTGSQRVAKRLQDVGNEVISNPGSAGGVNPVIVTYQANEQRDPGLKHVVVDRPQDELLESRTERCLKNIEQGINLPAGVISGLGTATHWGGGQIEESTFREHVEPLMILIVQALTSAFLRPILEDENSGVEEPTKYFIWYDPSNLIVHKDKAQNSIRAVELGLIGPPAARRELGFSETDAPTDEELEQMREWLSSIRSADKQGIVPNPQAPDNPKDPNAPPTQNAPGKRTPSEQPAAPLKRPGQKVVAAAIQAMADEKVRRALEKAGNKLRSRAKKVPAYSNALRGIPAEDVARTLGREACIKLGIDDLFTDSFDSLPSRVLHFTDGETTIDLNTISALKGILKEISASALFAPHTEKLLVPIEVIEAALAHNEEE